MNQLLLATTNSNADAIQGLFGFMVFIGLVFTVTCVIFPFMVWAKFNAVLRQLRQLESKVK